VLICALFAIHIGSRRLGPARRSLLWPGSRALGSGSSGSRLLCGFRSSSIRECSSTIRLSKSRLPRVRSVAASALLRCLRCRHVAIVLVDTAACGLFRCYEVPAQPNVMIQMQPGFAQQPVMAQGQPAMAVATAVPMQGQPVMAVATAMPAKAVTNP
jgi:hypothetical protein